MRRTIINLVAALAVAVSAQAAEVIKPQIGKPLRDAAAALAGAASSPSRTPAELARDFAEPPVEHRLRAWWFWTIPYLNPEGIAKDVAAMAEAGMGGVNMMTHPSTGGVPKGWGTLPGIPYNSPEYYKLVGNTLDDLSARGMQFDTHNVEFYKGAAGRWVTHDQGMRMIRIEHLHLTGPKKLAEAWPKFPAGEAQCGKDASAWLAKWPAVFGVNKSPIPPGDRATFRPIAAFAIPGRITPLHAVEINVDMLLDRDFDKGTKLLGSQGVVPADKIVRLDGRISPEGAIDWDVPAGDWTILRFFSEPTGHVSAGIEVDKWDRELFMDTVDKQIGTIVEQNKNHIGKTFIAIEQDSWESSIQTWSANMAEVFRKRRGYDPLPWLPVLAGVAVNSKEESERFIWDLRRTVADQFTFVGWITFLKEWATARGLQFSLEGIPIPCINLTEWWGVVDKPMDEAWFTDPWEPSLHKHKTLAAAVADYYGRPVVGLEAFTDLTHLYLEHPGNLKPLADSFLCAGFNQLITHCYPAQPFDEKPGYGLYGINNNRSSTWWPVARPFFLSIGRAQTMLQQLTGVADVLVVETETPLLEWRKDIRIKSLPRELKYDACGSQELVKLKVKNGQIVSPLGKRYKALALLAPDVDIAGALHRITPETLTEIDRLSAAGVKVFCNAKKPTGSPSLAGYPESSAKSAALGEKLWGGGIVRPFEQIGQGIEPDISGQGDLNWTHRRSDALDAYFLANHATVPVAHKVSFRMSGCQPQLWHPETGTVEPILAWREEGGRTVVPLRFDPLESYFVVFAKESAAAPHWTAIEGPEGADVSVRGGKPVLKAATAGTWSLIQSDGAKTEVAAAAPPAPIEVGGPWTLTYPPGQDTPATLTLEKLQNMREHSDPMVRGFSGTVTYRTKFTVPAGTLGRDLEFLLDLGNVQQVAMVKLNGKEFGIAHRRPYILPVGDALKVGSNELEVQVTNTWLNRMVAQVDLPKEKRLGDPSSWLDEERVKRTKSYKPLAEHGYLMDSGWIGPVRLIPQRVVEIHLTTP